MKIAIFASGAGSNFQAIAQAVKNKEIKCQIAFLFSDNPGCYAIEEAEDMNIDHYAFTLSSAGSKENFEKKILGLLEKHDVQLICLAGYMKIIGPTILKKYHHKIINIHPSLLPQFKGKDAIAQALDAGVKETGVTVHYVDEGIDTGPIICQEKLSLLDNENLDSLTKRIHQLEHEIYIKAIKKVIR